jgi:hypothetical protein
MPRPAKARDRVFSIRALRFRRAEAWSRSAVAIRQRARQHLPTSSDPTLLRPFRDDRISSSRTCEVQIPQAPAKSAQASFVFGISGSAVDEWRAAELRPGNRSCIPPFGSGGSASSQSPVAAEEDGDCTNMLFRLRHRCSKLISCLKIWNATGSISPAARVIANCSGDSALHGQNRADFLVPAIEDRFGGRPA